jgi:hypothetical protein
VDVVEVRSVCRIDRPVDEVRAQFADVEHHAETQVHRNVRFEPVAGSPQRFRQLTCKGPLRLRQEIEMDGTDDGGIVQRVVAGSLCGSTLTFGFAPAGSGTTVTATAQVPLRGLGRLAGRLLARSMRRALATALDEDRLDLESERYATRRT